jgi:hypothetical protein
VTITLTRVGIVATVMVAYFDSSSGSAHRPTRPKRRTDPGSLSGDITHQR